MSGVFKTEFYRNLTKSYLIGLLVFCAFGAGILQIGIEKYKYEIEQHEQFSELEQVMARKIFNYVQYGGIGFRIILKPSPLMSLFHNNSAFVSLVGFVDSGIKLRINEPKTGKYTFNKPTGGYLDYSWYLFVIGSIFIMPWGFYTFRNKKYIRFLGAFASPKSVYINIISSRILLIVVAMTILTGIAYLQFLINGFVLSAREILSLCALFLVTTVVLTFLLISSAAIGARIDKIKGATFAIFFGVLIILIWPELFNTYFARKAGTSLKSTHVIEGQKLSKLMEFEKEALKQMEQYKKESERKDSDRRMAEHYWENIFNDLENINFALIERTAKLSRIFHLMSIFNPVTFLKTTNNELSSVGFIGFLDLYRRNRENKRGFLRFYIDKIFYEKSTKVVPYLAKGKNIIPVKSSLPSYFGLGLLVNLFYILCLFFFCYYCFIRYYFPLPAKSPPFETFSLNYESGKLIRHHIVCPYLRNQILNLFYGRVQGFAGQLTLDGKPLYTPGRKNFIYIPNPNKLPQSLRTMDLISFYRADKETFEKYAGKRYGDLSYLEKNELLLSLATGGGTDPRERIYLLDNYFTDQEDFSEITDMVESIKEEGILVLDFVSITRSPFNPDILYFTKRGESSYVTRTLT